MVNNKPLRNLSSKDCKCRVRTDGRQYILKGPVYKLEVVKTLVEKNKFLVVNEKAKASTKKLFQPEMLDDELYSFIMALRMDRYVESERCHISGGQTVDCDAYAMHWNRNRKAEWEYGAKIYVKFGFAEFDPTLLIISIKPSAY